jgi:S-adenosyl methyltransferase
VILRRTAEVLDFGQPAAVLLLGVLHLIQDSEDPRGIVARLMERGLIEDRVRVSEHIAVRPEAGHLQHRSPVLVTKNGRMSRSNPRHNPPARGRRAGRRPGAGRALFTAGRGTTMSFRSRAALRRALES